MQDLLLFYSSTEKKLVTLREYVDRMPESQKYIYYAAGENVSAIDHLPQTELLKDKNYEILYLTGETDEFVLQMLGPRFPPSQDASRVHDCGRGPEL